ncbi:MAG: hypothetical protein KJO86_00245 [Muriicola sp.]|nr:hypothetical protein [Muriicola sp.]
MIRTAFETFDYDTKCGAAAEAWINNARRRVAYPDMTENLPDYENSVSQEKELRKGAVREMKKLMREIG